DSKSRRRTSVLWSKFPYPDRVLRTLIRISAGRCKRQYCDLNVKTLVRISKL
ncbi:unnamed protein product, partial [Amoebophrya sp. A25]